MAGIHVMIQNRVFVTYTAMLEIQRAREGVWQPKGGWRWM